MSMNLDLAPISPFNTLMRISRSLCRYVHNEAALRAGMRRSRSVSAAAASHDIGKYGCLEKEHACFAQLLTVRTAA